MLILYYQVAYSEEKRKPKSAKRSMVVKALTSSSLREKYDQLIEERLKIASMQERLLQSQIQLCKDEIANKNAEHLQRMEIMNTELLQSRKKMELMDSEHSVHLKQIEIMNVELQLKIKQLNRQ